MSDDVKAPVQFSVFPEDHGVRLSVFNRYGTIDPATARALANELRLAADKAEEPSEHEMVAADNGTIRFATGGRLGNKLHVSCFPNGRSIAFDRMEAIQGLHFAIMLAQKMPE